MIAHGRAHGRRRHPVPRCQPSKQYTSDSCLEYERYTRASTSLQDFRQMTLWSRRLMLRPRQLVEGRATPPVEVTRPPPSAFVSGAAPPTWTPVLTSGFTGTSRATSVCKRRDQTVVGQVVPARSVEPRPSRTHSGIVHRHSLRLGQLLEHLEAVGIADAAVLRSAERQ